MMPPFQVFQIPQSLTTVLEPVGRPLLIGSFGAALARAMHGAEDWDAPFVRLSVGVLALLFYREGAGILSDLSSELCKALQQVESEDIRTYVLNALEKAGQPGQGASSAFDLPALVEQVWRTGVWGVMTLLVEWIFLISFLILESARAVLWQLLLTVVPIGCGIYPLCPKILLNLVIYGVELSLWLPLLLVVEMSAGAVAKNYLTTDEAFGLHLIAVQVVSVLLILSIPMVSHRFLSGALSGDLGTGAGVLQAGKRAIGAAKAWASL